LEKYIGKYRVCCEWDRGTLEPIKDDLHIQCYKNGQIYRVDDSSLAYYRCTKGNSEQLSNKLTKLGVKGVRNFSTDGDILLHFKEESLDIVVNELGVVISGASISPYSIKNLRKLDWFKKNKQWYLDRGLYKELTEEEKETYRERFKEYVSQNK